jgi:hypothetical protein
VSKVRVILLLAVLLGIGVPLCWFVMSSFMSGWNDPNRAKPAAAASGVVPPSSAPPVKLADKQAAGDLAADFGTNIVDLKDPGTHYVPALPWVHGGAHHGLREGMVTSGAFEVRGSIQEMEGVNTIRLPSGPSAGGVCTLEIAVANGTVRGYLNGLHGSIVTGYVWVEATPGHPGRVTGYLEDWSNSSTPEATFTIESLKPADMDASASQYGGRQASGVSYRVFRK